MQPLQSVCHVELLTGVDGLGAIAGGVGAAAALEAAAAAGRLTGATIRARVTRRALPGRR